MTDRKKKHLKGFLIDDLKKLEETIKKVEDNDIYNGFNIDKHKENVERLTDFHTYWSIHAKNV
jgi:hypothetical protein